MTIISLKIYSVHDTDLIFSHVSYLLSIGQLEFETLFTYELAPFPTDLCHDSGEPWFTTSKSVLKIHLKSVVSSRNLKFDSIILDGNAMLLLFIGQRVLQMQAAVEIIAY